MFDLNRIPLGPFLTIVAVVVVLLAATAEKRPHRQPQCDTPATQTLAPQAEANIRMALLQERADAEAVAVSQAYEQADFDLMRGVVLEPTPSEN